MHPLLEELKQTPHDPSAFDNPPMTPELANALHVLENMKEPADPAAHAAGEKAFLTLVQAHFDMWLDHNNLPRIKR